MATTIEGGNRDAKAAFWMPFTANRQFKQAPKVFVSADRMHYQTDDGRQVLDGMAGLWCVNAGHNQRPIVEAIKAQADKLDFVSSFSMSHPGGFDVANKIAALTPGTLDHVFFTNSGSEAVDTALKIARAYHRVRGEVGRTRFIGRARAYHGVGWGGLSVGGIGRQRKDFVPLLSDVAHLSATHSLEHQAFTKGQPAWGAHLADELLTQIQIHDASTIAAVIVEPVAGSGGVLPPPKGYLERLRAICDQYGILLIFDEVITGFGRLGTPFAAEALGVTPDLITCAKGLTNGSVPMGAAIASQKVFDAFMGLPDGAVEFMHGYTYSAHPLACAAAAATIDVYKDQGLFERAGRIAPIWEEAVHSLRGAAADVVDIRNHGILAAIELAPRAPGQPSRAGAVSQHAYENGVLVRLAGDALVLSPPLIIEESQIGQIVDTIAQALKAAA